MEQVRKMDAPGEALAVYWLESNFGQEPFSLQPDETAAARKRWERAMGGVDYLSLVDVVWGGLDHVSVA